MNMFFKFCAVIVAACSALYPATPVAAADAYPARAVTLVVPYPPGGTIDNLARDFADHLRSRWKTPVIVENRGGGNGVIGVEYVRRATPDGYTLLIGGGSTHSVGPATDPEMKYDPIGDFSAIAYFGETPMVLTAGPTLGTMDFKQMVARAKTKPDGLTYGSVGTSTMLVARMLDKATGSRLVQVNYKQFGQALIDITRGDVDMGISSMSIVLGNLQQKILRPLAVTSKQRSPLFPDVPAVAELYPGFEVSIWFGLFGPASMPESLKTELNKEVAAFQRASGRMEKWGVQAFNLRAQSVGEFASYVQSDYSKWRTLATEAGLRTAR